MKNEGRQEMLAAAAQVTAQDNTWCRLSFEITAATFGKEGCPYLQELGVGCSEEGDTIVGVVIATRLTSSTGRIGSHP